MTTDRTLDLLDRPELLDVLFHPRRDVAESGRTSGRAVHFPIDGGLTIGGRVFAAAVAAPVLVYFHGNGEIALDYEAIAPFYTRLGVTLLVIDYRGYGASDGTPTATAMLADARACFAGVPAALAEVGIAAGGRPFLMGRSLGSAAALEIAADPDQGAAIAGLIIESGFADTFALIARIGLIRTEGADEHRHGFANLAKMAKVQVPTLVIHGEWDTIIPIGDGEALFGACPVAEKRFVKIPEAGHNDLMMTGREVYFDSIARFCGGARSPG